MTAGLSGVGRGARRSSAIVNLDRDCVDALKGRFIVETWVNTALGGTDTRRARANRAFPRDGRELVMLKIRAWACAGVPVAVALLVLILGVSAAFVGAEHGPDPVPTKVLMKESGIGLASLVKRVTEPAIARGQHLAATDGLRAGLRAGSREELIDWCNRQIRSATEIDSIAVFDREGEILAINTVFADGTEIAPERIEGVLSRDFSDRPIVMRCVTNNAAEEVLEYQRNCDITPALFDSSGLSVAHSLPVHDTNGDRLGVISTRMNFDRISSLICDTKLLGGAGQLWFVSDDGGFFDEKINSGAQPPLSAEHLEKAVQIAKTLNAGTLTFENNDQQYMLFPMTGLHTLAGGGIQVLMVAPEHALATAANPAPSRVLPGPVSTWASVVLALLVLIEFGMRALRRAGSSRSSVLMDVRSDGHRQKRAA